MSYHRVNGGDLKKANKGKFWCQQKKKQHVKLCGMGQGL